MTVPAKLKPPLVVYVDVDDTLVRTVGTRRIPVGPVVDHVRSLAAEGVVLYCWSSGGAEYAREVATELGLAACFAGFLPKPQVLLDDQSFGEWRRLVQVHPGRCGLLTVAAYRRAVDGDEPIV